MIYDLISNKDLYVNLGEKFKKAFDFIVKGTEEDIAVGKYEIDGDDVYASVSEYDTKTEGNYEGHIDYIDVQYILKGHEEIYWKNINDCTLIKDYTPDKDVKIYSAENPVVLDMPAGAFAIFYPTDAHAPNRAYKEVSHVKKIVVKIKVD